MKLERIEILNFRQFCDKQSPLVFSKDPNKNVTIIQGINGTGKSNLFKAINWCIYGKVDDNGDIASKARLSCVKIGEVVITEVRVNFTHEAKKYLLSRSIECLKKSKTSHVYQNEEFTMMKINEVGRTEKVDNPIGEINSILPENVRTYFLFDGEKIDNFSRPESASDVKKAIYNVLKLEVLIRSKKHLDEIAKEYREELRLIASQELSDLLELYDSKKNDKEKIIKRQEELDIEITLARDKIKEIDKKLEGMKEASQLQKDRNHLEQDVEHKRTDLNRCIQKIRNITMNSLGIVGAQMLENAFIIIDEKRIKGEIPSNIRDQFLQDIIDRKQCICGRKFDHGSSEHQNLVSLQCSSIPSSIQEEVLNLNSGIKSIQNEAILLEQSLDEEIKNRILIVEQIKKNDAQIDELSRKLKGSRLEDIKRLEEQRDSFKNDIDRYIMDKGKNVEKIKNIDKELIRIKNDIDKARKDEVKQELLTNKMNLSQGAADAINNIYQQFADEMRVNIEQKTKEIFKQLVWKESQFQDIKLDQDYNMDVTDRWGYQASPELSAGERQVLSLSFITAMARATGEEAPIVMDTPFGRLSTLHREKITETIPGLSDQLVLFVTEEEMRGQMEKNLLSRIGERYLLNFNDKTGCTTIEHI